MSMTGVNDRRAGGLLGPLLVPAPGSERVVTWSVGIRLAAAGAIIVSAACLFLSFVCWILEAIGCSEPVILATLTAITILSVYRLSHWHDSHLVLTNLAEEIFKKLPKQTLKTQCVGENDELKRADTTATAAAAKPQTCPICLEEMLCGQLIAHGERCKHACHAACLQEWVSSFSARNRQQQRLFSESPILRNSTCPCCRQDLLMEEHSPIPTFLSSREENSSLSESEQQQQQQQEQQQQEQVLFYYDEAGQAFLASFKNENDVVTKVEKWLLTIMNL